MDKEKPVKIIYKNIFIYVCVFYFLFNYSSYVAAQEIIYNCRTSKEIFEAAIKDRASNVLLVSPVSTVRILTVRNIESGKKFATASINTYFVNKVYKGDNDFNSKIIHVVYFDIYNDIDAIQSNPQKFEIIEDNFEKEKITNQYEKYYLALFAVKNLYKYGNLYNIFNINNKLFDSLLPEENLFKQENCGLRLPMYSNSMFLKEIEQWIH